MSTYYYNALIYLFIRTKGHPKTSLSSELRTPKK